MQPGAHPANRRKWIPSTRLLSSQSSSCVIGCFSLTLIELASREVRGTANNSTAGVGNAGKPPLPCTWPFVRDRIAGPSHAPDSTDPILQVQPTRGVGCEHGTALTGDLEFGSCSSRYAEGVHQHSPGLRSYPGLAGTHPPQPQRGCT